MKNSPPASPDPTPPSPLMTKEEVAQMLKKSQRTIEHWVNGGYLSAIRIGHSVLFEREQLMRDLRRFQSAAGANGD